MEREWQNVVSLLIELINEGHTSMLTVHLPPTVARDKLDLAVTEVLHRLRFLREVAHEIPRHLEDCLK
jgi:hypothetical protein